MNKFDHFRPFKIQWKTKSEKQKLYQFAHMLMEQQKNMMSSHPVFMIHLSLNPAQVNTWENTRFLLMGNRER